MDQRPLRAGSRDDHRAERHVHEPRSNGLRHGNRHPLKSQAGGMVFELLFILPLALIVLILLFEVFRAVEGSWATTVASRLAAWSALRGLTLGPSDLYDEQIHAMTAEIEEVTFEQESSTLEHQADEIREALPRADLVELIPSIRSATAGSLVKARAESRSRSPWGGCTRTTAVSPGTFTSAEAGVNGGSYRAAVDDLTSFGILKVLP